MTLIMQSNWRLQETKNKLIKQEQRREQREREREREREGVRSGQQSIPSFTLRGFRREINQMVLLNFFGKIFRHFLLRKRCLFMLGFVHRNLISARRVLSLSVDHFLKFRPLGK
jgi:hypothetical protein